MYGKESAKLSVNDLSHMVLPAQQLAMIVSQTCSKLYSSQCFTASFPGSTAQRVLHIGNTWAGSVIYALEMCERRWAVEPGNEAKFSCISCSPLL